MVQTAAKRVKNRGATIAHSPTSAVLAGDVIEIGSIPMVAEVAIAANVAGAVACEGVFDLPKASGDGGIAAGAEVYWDVAETVAKTDSETDANKKLGKAVAAAADTDTTVRVRLSQ